MKRIAFMLIAALGMGMIVWTLSRADDVGSSGAESSLAASASRPPGLSDETPAAKADARRHSVVHPYAAKVAPSSPQEFETGARNSSAHASEFPSLRMNERIASDGHFSSEVVGRPFPLSPLLSSYCQSHPVVRATNCKEIFKLLKRFTDEQRDERWAPVIEAKIRAQVPRALPDAEIRAVECRTTVCAVEVTSHTNELGYLFTYEYGVDKTVIDSAMVESAIQTDPSTGTPVFTTVRVFERSE